MAGTGGASRQCILPAPGSLQPPSQRAAGSHATWGTSQPPEEPASRTPSSCWDEAGDLEPDGGQPHSPGRATRQVLSPACPGRGHRGRWRPTQPSVGGDCQGTGSQPLPVAGTTTVSIFPAPAGCPSPVRCCGLSGEPDLHPGPRLPPGQPQLNPRLWLVHTNPPVTAYVVKQPPPGCTRGHPLWPGCCRLPAGPTGSSRRQDVGM